MAAAGSEVGAIFEKLNTAVTNGQHKRAKELAESILQAVPNDEDALKCKAVALLQMGEYGAALKFIDATPALQNLTLERAYCLYQLERFQEALRVCGNISGPQAAAALQLKAQLHYRLGDTKECIRTYDQLSQTHKLDSLELKTNVLAAYVAARLVDEIPELMSAMKITVKQSYEVAHNKACSLVEAGDYEAAEKILVAAIKQGTETLFGEDFTEEEVEEELAPLNVQLAYVWARLGRVTEAVEKLEGVLQANIGDVAAACVAANNRIADTCLLEGEAPSKKFYSSALKKLEAMVNKKEALALVRGLESRLSGVQKEALHLNRALLYYLTNRAEDCRALTESLAKHYPTSHLVAMMQAALLMKDKKLDEADQLLASYCSAHPPSSVYPMLMRAQLALDRNNAAGALQVLEGVDDPEFKGAPALLVTRVTLQEQLGDLAGVERLLEAAVGPSSPWGPPSPEGVSWCLRHLVEVKLMQGKVPEAIQYYQKLMRNSGPSVESSKLLARLARLAAATSDQDCMKLIATEVPSQVDTRGVDVEELQRSMATTASQQRRKEEGWRKRDADEIEGDSDAKPKKHKKKRKKRLPKGYDPSLPNGGLPAPDPERWLPKWQRSEERRKKKSKSRREREAIKGSQGAGKVDEALDRTKAGDAETSRAGEQKSAPKLPNRGKGKGRK